VGQTGGPVSAAEIERALGTLDQEGVESLVADLGSVPDPQLRRGLFRLAMGRWAEIDAGAALQHLDTALQGGGDPRDQDAIREGYSAVFAKLAESDPARAFKAWSESAAAAGGAMTTGDALYQIMDRWRMSDPGAAFAAWRRSGRNEAMSALFNGLEDPGYRAAAYENIVAPATGKRRSDLLGSFIRSWAATEDERSSVVEWIDAQSYPPQDLVAAERAVAKVFVRRAGAETADWLVSRATGDTLPGHLEAIVSAWANVHPNACGQWLAQRELGPHTDLAVGEFATTIMRDDLASAYAWAARISDGQRRFQALSTITSHAARNDPATARSTITGTGLGISPEQAAELLQILE
jgi:hypothetical protein